MAITAGRKKCRYTVERGQEIRLNGKPYLRISPEDAAWPAEADELTYQIARWLNRKGCFLYEKGTWKWSR